MERIDNRSWPSNSKFQINTEKVVETTIAKASEVEPQSWVAPEENRNKKELKLQNRYAGSGLSRLPSIKKFNTEIVLQVHHQASLVIS